MRQSVKIAGDLTVSDWKTLSAKLRKDMDNPDLWEEAFGYLETRLETRYLKPIEHIKENGSNEGEGFAIVAIICSIIEAMESFYQGKSYRKGTKSTPIDTNTEYYRSQPIFESFLQSREPFKSHFAVAGLATSFYEDVRCAILHEAATRGGWKIRTDTSELLEQQGSNLVLNRNLFVDAIKDYLVRYKTELFSDSTLKEAFIRKFDSTCASAK